LFTEEVPYVDNSPKDSEVITIKDMFNFMQRQSEQNTELVKAVLNASSSQSETLKNYIDLFKPRTVESPSLGEREAMKAARVDVDEWETLDTVDKFNALLSDGVPPEVDGF